VELEEITCFEVFVFAAGAGVVADALPYGRQQCRRMADEAGAVDDAVGGLDRHQQSSA